MKRIAVAALLLSGCWLSHELGDEVTRCGAPACRRGAGELEVVRLDGSIDPGRYQGTLAGVRAAGGSTFFDIDYFRAIHFEERVVLEVRGVVVPVDEIPYRGPVDFSFRSRALVIDRAEPLELVFAAVAGGLSDGFDAPLAGYAVDEGETVCEGIGDFGDHSGRQRVVVRDLRTGESVERDALEPVAMLGALRVSIPAAGWTCRTADLAPPLPLETQTIVLWSTVAR